jgi:hypothetical protein
MLLMITTNRSGASALWILLLMGASVLTTLALACATPFAAIASLAALHMRRRDGLILMLGSWAASQAIGFGLLHYPHTASTFAWGLGLGTAALGALLGAEASLARFSTVPMLARIAIGFVAAFAAYKIVLLGWSLMLGGTHTAIAPMIAARQFGREAAILVVLTILARLLLALGVPAPARPLRAA